MLLVKNLVLNKIRMSFASKVKVNMLFRTFHIRVSLQHFLTLVNINRTFYFNRKLKGYFLNVFLVNVKGIINRNLMLGR